MLDLSFGLPITVRDAALKMIAPGPTSDVNREYYAQEHEREIEEGRGGLEEYDKTDEKARDLLRRLANSEPYYKKRRRIEAASGDGDEEDGSASGNSEQKRLPAPTSTSLTPHKAGPVRTHPSSSSNKLNRTRPFPSTTTLPPQQSDILPPANPKITSLFLTGVEDDMPEHTLRSHFSQYGTLRSLVCSHRSHCAFVNYASRDSAEQAAAACQGRAVVAGVPLRVQWGRPKPLDSLETEERMRYARAGRETERAVKAASGPGPGGRNGGGQAGSASRGEQMEESEIDDLAKIAPPPGMDEGDDRAKYASLAGD